MNKKTYFSLLLLLIVTLIRVDAQPKLTFDLNNKGVAISPTHYGIFFEDINHAADGGLYAELIKNRSFENATTLVDWATMTSGTGAITATIDNTELLNSAQTQSLKVAITSANANSRAGITNAGFWGINVVRGQKYNLSFFTKCLSDFNGTVTVSLEDASGVVYAKQTVSGISTTWQKLSTTLIPTGNTTAGILVISFNTTGTVWLDVVSLFPPTYNSRENGLRPDLAKLIEDLHPKFLRFPGGCFVEGDYLANRFQWKKTIGKIEERPGHYNLWGYRTTDGMGYHEYLQLCEDLGAAPLFVVNIGLAHNDYQDYTVLTDYIQDALDAIEYANGDVTTTYGAMRAAAGHPKPFNLKFIEIGNENYSGNNYEGRYIQFFNAIKTKYPNIQCIGNVADWGTDSPSWTFSSPVDIVDEHYYRSPQWFVNQYNKYDTYSRTGPKVYAGEYAVTSNCGLGNLSAAVGEAVYMCGMEKNSDIVSMNSYAPIFVNVNDRKWSPDMIDYDASGVYCTPSYYVQKMFANNIGTVNIKVKDSLNTKINAVTGSVGLGSWSTKVDYSTVAVNKTDGTSLFSDSFNNSANWTAGTGTWSVASGIYSQTGTSTNCTSIGKTINDSVYSYTLKARKKSGSEGFLIIFGYKDSNNYYWWNLGGWTNTKHAIEHCVGGTKTVVNQINGSISTNVWYDIRIDVSSTKVDCYLNGTLTQSIDLTSEMQLYTSASVDNTANQLYVKIVNPHNEDITSTLDFKGLTTNKISGEITQMASANSQDENSLATSNYIVPTTTSIDSQLLTFNYTLKANSVNVLKICTNGLNSTNVVKEKEFSISPNPASKIITVHSDNNDSFTLEIKNLKGQLMSKNKVVSGSNIDLSFLKPGMYMVSAIINGSEKNLKLIVR